MAKCEVCGSIPEMRVHCDECHGAAPTPSDLSKLSISGISRIIRRDWTKVNFAAAPYLSAMSSLESVSDAYGCDDGRSIVTYFLCNASTWRGPVAKSVKAELKRRVSR